MDAKTKKVFRRKFLDLIQLKDMTQADLVRRSGLKKDRISYYVNGGAPTPEKLKRIAAALEVSPEHLITEKDDDVQTFVFNVDRIEGTRKVQLQLNATLPDEIADQILKRVARYSVLSASQHVASEIFDDHEYPDEWDAEAS